MFFISSFYFFFNVFLCNQLRSIEFIFRNQVYFIRRSPETANFLFFISDVTSPSGLKISIFNFQYRTSKATPDITCFYMSRRIRSLKHVFDSCSCEIPKLNNTMINNNHLFKILASVRILFSKFEYANSLLFLYSLFQFITFKFQLPSIFIILFLHYFSQFFFFFFTLIFIGLPLLNRYYYHHKNLHLTKQVTVSRLLHFA
jgi:hypothetical protein